MFAFYLFVALFSSFFSALLRCIRLLFHFVSFCSLHSRCFFFFFSVCYNLHFLDVFSINAYAVCIDFDYGRLILFQQKQNKNDLEGKRERRAKNWANMCVLSFRHFCLIFYHNIFSIHQQTEQKTTVFYIGNVFIRYYSDVYRLIRWTFKLNLNKTRVEICVQW